MHILGEHQSVTLQSCYETSKQEKCKKHFLRVWGRNMKGNPACELARQHESCVSLPCIFVCHQTRKYSGR